MARQGEGLEQGEARSGHCRVKKGMAKGNEQSSTGLETGQSMGQGISVCVRLRGRDRQQAWLGQSRGKGMTGQAGHDRPGRA